MTVLLSVVLIYLLHSPTRALLAPKLTVNKQLITETDSVMLDCRAPRSPVLNCYFEVVNTKSTMVLSCLTTVTGQELLRRSQQVPPAVVQVECFYTVKYGDLHSPSPHSIISSITVEGDPQTTALSVASTFGTPASVFPSVIGRKSTSSTFTPPTSAGWTLAHTDGFLISSLKPGGAASDERDEKTKSKDGGWWMVKVVVALTSFGGAAGVILLGLTLRRTVSERTRRSEGQNTEDEYHMYSTITDQLAPSVKGNVVYSKVEAH